jgi:hypothetical protein
VSETSLLVACCIFMRTLVQIAANDCTGYSCLHAAISAAAYCLASLNAFSQSHAAPPGFPFALRLPLPPTGLRPSCSWGSAAQPRLTCTALA